jgi:hypothetical protein
LQVYKRAGVLVAVAPPPAEEAGDEDPASPGAY